MTKWKDMTDEQKRNCYESYVGDVIYEFGDDAKYMTYEDWCKESESLGEAFGCCD